MVTTERVSMPGRYSGYATPSYTEWMRSSQYVPVRDGTRLAVDLYRPAIDGRPVETPHPVLWSPTPYVRAYYDAEGKPVLSACSYAGGIVELTKFGYVVAVADLRGRGASYGISWARQDWTEAWDMHDVNEWLGIQPWSDGNVGMWGCSYPGSNQLRAASTAPPHLKAIFVASGATGDLYEKQRRGGILQRRSLSWAEDALRRPAVPVDEDTDGRLLEEAQSSHQFNGSPADLWRSLPYRDSFSPISANRFYLENGPLYYRERVEHSRVAMYHWLTWNDTTGSRLKLVDAMNFNNPTKLMIAGNWGHCGGMAAGTRALPGIPDSERIDLLVEHHRFFDYFLKGIDNGLMDEPRVYYYTHGLPAGSEWRFGRNWPLPDERRERLYLRATGRLTATPPAADEPGVDYQVVFDLTVKNMAERGLTFTSAPLPVAAEVTGHPVLHLWVSSTATDGDFFAILEEIDAQGGSVLGPWPHIDGRLRASHRALHEPSFNNFGLPWHRSYAEDMVPLTPGEPVELVFDLMPLSNLFQTGNRLRVTIAGAAFDGTGPGLPLDELPPPAIRVYHDAEHLSFIELPVVGGELPA